MGKKKSNQSVYDELKAKGYTDEDIAESFIFPAERTPEQDAQWAKELNDFREKRWAAMTEEEREKEKKQINDLAEKFRKEDEDETSSDK